jgi:hypothetical protein
MEQRVLNQKKSFITSANVVKLIQWQGESLGQPNKYFYLYSKSYNMVIYYQGLMS